MGPFAVDRFLIDLTLGPVPAAIPRQTYHGIYNIAQFDLSFSVACTAPNTGDSVASTGKDLCVQTQHRIVLYFRIDILPSALWIIYYVVYLGVSIALFGGVVGGLLAVILIIIFLACLMFFIFKQRKLNHEGNS